MDVRPTLFIGVGGTGMEVLLRVRRRILNNLWGNAGRRVRIDSLTEFPVAQFIQLDLDSGAVIDSGRSQSEDLQYEQVKFSDDDKIVETFDMEKYSRDEDALEKYPHIKEWLPLTPGVIANLGIDPSKGAGQIRAVSRMYFFDKYTKIRDKIRSKLKTLKSGLSHEQQLNHLGLKMERSKFRIVVVGSVAGGTGSGVFLDMGWLARWLADNEVGSADVDLMLFMPTGYNQAGKDRTEANGYAALMELESAMRGNRAFVGRWDPHDRPALDREPYKEVFLIDSGNLAQQHTKDLKDVYHLVADSLFEDFASGDFARRKRSVAVNQAQHKNYLHDALVPRNRFPDMRLSYSKRYSAFGQSVLDTRQEARREKHAHEWAGAMLRAFFGVGSSDAAANRATDKQRDEFMASHLALRPTTFSDFPEFSDTGIELKRSSGEFIDYFVVNDLLQDKQGALLGGVEQRVNDRINDIRSGFDRKEWATQVRDAIRQLERDAVRDQDSTADTTEDRVAKRRRELLSGMRVGVREQLYGYLDNKQFGGLEYVLSLVEQIKDRLEAPGTGLLTALGVNAERYREIKDAVRSREIERLLDNLAQTRGGLGGLFGSGEKQAGLIMDQLRTEIANGIKFHLRAKAADEAVLLMQELSAWLGRKTGIDAQGRAQWNGLVGEFQAGREGVLQMLEQLQRADDILQKDLNASHATSIVLATTEQVVAMPGAAQLREWADEAFKDLGGSKALFPMLADTDQRATLQNKVLRMAHNQLLLVAQQSEGAAAGDPLIEALEQLDPMARSTIFSKLLNCAMPWIDANLGGDFAVNADQFKCFIGVAGAAEFSRKFGAEIEACAPTHVGLTGTQITVVESGLPGRAVCYCELSGVPLTVLRGIEGWRTSYRKETDKSPTHTHIDLSQFTHPIAPSTDEINTLAEDFKHYLQAVMIGEVERVERRIVPPGQYLFSVEEGERRRIGNERMLRLNGLPPAYRGAIMARVQDRVTAAKLPELVALYTLSRYYERTVYAPRLIQDSNLVEKPHQGFASAISAEIRNELQARIRRCGLSDEDLKAQSDLLRRQLSVWAEPIEFSDADAYAWEVREVEERDGPRLKYRLRADAVSGGLIERVLAANQPQPGAAGVVTAMMPGVPAAMPPLTGGAMPPIPTYQYHVAVNGQPYGPFDAAMLRQMLATGQVQPGSKVWREGWSAWVDLNQSPELQSLFAAPSAMPLVPGMPSLP
ncbi:MAG: tubulin-like doman-containing protein [Comamonas sp.]